MDLSCTENRRWHSPETNQVSDPGGHGDNERDWPECGMLDVYKRTNAVTTCLCPACRADGEKPLHILVCESKKIFGLFHCRVCDSRFYDPFPKIDYYLHTNDGLDTRNYVESDAEIEFLFQNLAPVLSKRPKGTYLDVGCGYGFAVDLARRAFGWNAQGVEPSAYGKIGAASLDFPLLADFLTVNSPLEPKKFEVIHSSEVIEHTHDPREFVRILVQYLDQNGILVLTTPNSNAINDPATSISRKLAYLSAGAHTILFSQVALTNLLQETGLEHVRLFSHEGTIVAYAGREPFEIDRGDYDAAVLHRYYLEGISRAGADRSLRIGFGFRLYAMLVHAGRYEESSTIWKELGFDPPSEVPDLATYRQYLSNFPSSAAMLAFLRGIEHLNFLKAPDTAVQLFRTAYELARTKIRLAPSLSARETAMVWNARFHEALSILYAGDRSGSRVIADAILARNQYGSQDGLPVPPEEILSRIRSVWNIGAS